MDIDDDEFMPFEGLDIDNDEDSEDEDEDSDEENNMEEDETYIERQQLKKDFKMNVKRLTNLIRRGLEICKGADINDDVIYDDDGRPYLDILYDGLQDIEDYVTDFNESANDLGSNNSEYVFENVESGIKFYTTLISTLSKEISNFGHKHYDSIIMDGGSIRTIYVKSYKIKNHLHKYKK